MAAEPCVESAFPQHWGGIRNPPSRPVIRALHPLQASPHSFCDHPTLGAGSVSATGGSMAHRGIGGLHSGCPHKGWCGAALTAPYYARPLSSGQLTFQPGLLASVLWLRGAVPTLHEFWASVNGGYRSEISTQLHSPLDLDPLL